MKRRLFVLIFQIVPITLFSQSNNVTIELNDTLSKPQSLLKTEPIANIYANLLQLDYKSDVQTTSSIIQYCPLLASSFDDDRIVGDFGYNSFFFGMCEAYAHHRPVVLTPDAVWILICQGFANHINFNSNQFREMLVNLEGKEQLALNLETTPQVTNWYNAVESFYSMLTQTIKGDLASTMMCDYSTSSKVEKLVSQAILMESVKSYYDFIVIYSICGIPSITLEGTTDDWIRVREKTARLEQYELKWWTDRLLPILDEFVNASKGKADIDFWKQMIHVTEPQQCGDPRIIDGWITTFYPYDRQGNRFNGKSITDSDQLPSEIVKVKLLTHFPDATMGSMEIWAGLFGLEQDESTYALKPKIGWCVSSPQRKVIEKNLLEELNTPDSFYGIRLAVDSVPSVLKELGHIYRLDLTFNSKAHFPKWFKDLEIDNLTLRGKIPLDERIKAKSWFDDVRIIRNGHFATWFKRNFLMGKAKV